MVASDGSVFCREHFASREGDTDTGTVCLGCGKGIGEYEGYVTMQANSTGNGNANRNSKAQQHFWHSDCFKCLDCEAAKERSAKKSLSLGAAAKDIAARGRQKQKQKQKLAKVPLLLGKTKEWGTCVRAWIWCSQSYLK